MGKKEGLIRGTWTAQEDQILKDYVAIHGQGKWGKIPLQTGKFLIFTLYFL